MGLVWGQTNPHLCPSVHSWVKVDVCAKSEEISWRPSRDIAVTRMRWTDGWATRKRNASGHSCHRHRGIKMSRNPRTRLVHFKIINRVNWTPSIDSTRWNSDTVQTVGGVEEVMALLTNPNVFNCYVLSFSVYSLSWIYVLSFCFC